MSNVLIGIIGVILFIGLALAGALFLGPRFQESQNNAKASAVVQVISQVSNALEMYRVQEGRIYQPANPLLPMIGLVGTYLRSDPANPTGPNDGIVLLSGIAPSGPTIVVALVLENNAKPICEAINRQTGGPTTIPAMSRDGNGRIQTFGTIRCYDVGDGQYAVFNGVG